MHGGLEAMIAHNRRNKKTRRNSGSLTEWDWKRFNYLAKKMDRLAKKKNRTWTSVDDLPAKEAAEFRRLGRTIGMESPHSSSRGFY